MNKLRYREEIIDLTFIGVGIATSYILIPLLRSLRDQNLKNPFRILLIEKSDENFTGLAYGKRSSSSTFLITALKDFLPFGEEREHFNSWLFSNKTILIHELLAEGGNLSKNWYETHKNDIQKNLWDDIYIPRLSLIHI